jgi:hypothetical protein
LSSIDKWIFPIVTKIILDFKERSELVGRSDHQLHSHKDL